jgi:hypothetical protein
MSKQPKRAKLEVKIEDLPEPLRRYIDEIAWLQMLCEPSVGSSIMALHSSPSANSRVPDAGLAHWQRMLDNELDHIRRDVRRISAKVERLDAPRLLSRPVVALNRSWQCAKCSKKQRNGARFCDGCGARRPDALPEEPRADAR